MCDARLGDSLRARQATSPIHHNNGSGPVISMHSDELENHRFGGTLDGHRAVHRRAARVRCLDRLARVPLRACVASSPRQLPVAFVQFAAFIRHC